MLKAATTATRAPRGTKPVSQAFFSALETIPEASRAAVAKSALVMIRDEMKKQKEKLKATAAKEKEVAAKEKARNAAASSTPAKAAPAKASPAKAAPTKRAAKPAAAAAQAAPATNGVTAPKKPRSRKIAAAAAEE